MLNTSNHTSEWNLEVNTPLILCTLYNKCILLFLELRPLSCHYNPQQLILESLRCDHKIQQCYLHTGTYNTINYYIDSTHAEQHYLTRQNSSVHWGQFTMYYEKIEPGRYTSQKYKHVQFLCERDFNAYNTNSVMPNKLWIDNTRTLDWHMIINRMLHAQLANKDLQLLLYICYM